MQTYKSVVCLRLLLTDGYGRSVRGRGNIELVASHIMRPYLAIAVMAESEPLIQLPKTHPGCVAVKTKVGQAERPGPPGRPRQERCRTGSASRVSTHRQPVHVGGLMLRNVRPEQGVDELKSNRTNWPTRSFGEKEQTFAHVR